MIKRMIKKYNFGRKNVYYLVFIILPWYDIIITQRSNDIHTQARLNFKNREFILYQPIEMWLKGKQKFSMNVFLVSVNLSFDNF